MFKKLMVSAMLFVLSPTLIFASQLQNQRIQTLKEYVRLLGQGDYLSITSLFAPQSIAVSSSGKIDNPAHFYKTLFTETIKKPNAKLINLFSGLEDPDMMTAYFDYSWDNLEHRHVAAKFLDLFVFQKNSAQLKAVYVFSNTFQDDIMKQLQR